jgi:D-tyrosyl-tRNA(Tyr) deacylase
VLQRVKSASVTVDGQLISSIGKGILVLAAVSKDDTEKDVEAMANKVLKTKLWDDDSKDPPGRVSIIADRYRENVLMLSSGNVVSRKLAEKFSVVGYVVFLYTTTQKMKFSHQNQALLTTAVSQFTLLASVKKGNRPDFHQSASGDKARSTARLAIYTSRRK